MLQEEKIYIYEYQRGYYVEINTGRLEPYTKEFWLCKEKYGSKLFMFGIPEKNNGEYLDEDFIKAIILGNIETYIKIYEEDQK